VSEAKTPNSRRNLDLAIQRVFGLDTDFVRTRAVIANTIVGQMLPSGVVKGGSSLKFRWGDTQTRFTTDLDTIRGSELEAFQENMSSTLARGWHGFTGRLVPKQPAKPLNVPTEYIMQPFEVKLSYKDKAWFTVALEIGHDEVDDVSEPDFVIAESVVEMFRLIGLPEPSPVPCMALKHQVSQKLHGLSEPESARAHDLIDLQLIITKASLDYPAVKSTCIRLFSYRNMQPWPPTIVENTGWGGLYDDQKTGLIVLDSVSDAIAWANELVGIIDGSD
jgi:hypothetical protein